VLQQRIAMHRLQPQRFEDRHLQCTREMRAHFSWRLAICAALMAVSSDLFPSTQMRAIASIRTGTELTAGKHVLSVFNYAYYA
jgi:hypothetical protein